MSAQPGSSRPRVHSSAKARAPGARAPARSRRSHAHAGGQFGPVCLDKWIAPRRLRKPRSAKSAGGSARNARRRRVEPGDFGPAIAFEVESRRAPGRMIAAMVFGLDDQACGVAPAISAPRLAPAIPPPMMTMSYSTALVTNSKAPPSSGRAMINAAFTEILLEVLLAAAAGRRGGDRHAHLHHFQPPQPGGRRPRAALLAGGRTAVCGPASRSSSRLAIGRVRPVRGDFLRRHDGRRRRQAGGGAGAVVLTRRDGKIPCFHVAWRADC